MPAIDYRAATADDAAAIGALHVASWCETYAGLLPQDMLDGLSPESRSAMWAAVLEAPGAPDASRVFVAQGSVGIVGFGACGGQRDTAMRERGFNGEVGAIYVLRSHQRAAVGRSLMGLMARDLIARRLASASLWVLRDNMGARRFYEGLGGSLIGEKMVAAGDASLPEVAYGWSDLSILL